MTDSLLRKGYLSLCKDRETLSKRKSIILLLLYSSVLFQVLHLVACLIASCKHCISPVSCHESLLDTYNRNHELERIFSKHATSTLIANQDPASCHTNMLSHSFFHSNEGSFRLARQFKRAHFQKGAVKLIVIEP